MLRDDETSVDTLRRRPRRHRHPMSRGTPRATPGPCSATCRTPTTNRPDCRCAHAERRRTRPARQSAGNDHREDVERPAAGCDRHAPAPTLSTARATCRPSLPKLLDTPNPAIRPRTAAARLRCPSSATPARPHPLIRYNRPDNRGGTEPTGALPPIDHQLDHARSIHASHAATRTDRSPHHPVRPARRPQRPPARSRGRTGRSTARHRRARFWEDACHLYARRASGPRPRRRPPLDRRP